MIGSGEIFVKNGKRGEVMAQKGKMQDKEVEDFFFARVLYVLGVINSYDLNIFRARMRIQQAYKEAFKRGIYGNKKSVAK